MALTQRERDELELELLELEEAEANSRTTLIQNEMKRRAQESVDKTASETEQYVKELAVDIPIKAAQGATLGFSDEIIGGAESLFTDKTYEESRDYQRGLQKRASDRSPVASALAEIAGGIPLGMGVASKFGSKIAPIMAEGLAYGIGESEGETIPDHLKSGAASALGSGVMHGLGRAANKAIIGKPSELRARYTGKTSTDFKSIDEFGDPVRMSEELDKIKFYEYPNSRYDVKTATFVPIGKSRERKGRLLPPTVGQSIANANRGKKDISKAKELLLANRKGSIDIFDLYEDLDSAFKPIIERATDKDIILGKIEKAVINLSKNMDGKVDYKILERMKQDWQKKAKRYYNKASGGTDPVFADDEIVDKTIAAVLRDRLEKDIPELKNLNADYRNLIMAKEGLVNERARAKGHDALSDSYVAPAAGIPYLMSKGAKMAGGGERGQLFRAKAGDFLDEPRLGRAKVDFLKGKYGDHHFPSEASNASKIAEGAIMSSKVIDPIQTTLGATESGINTIMGGIDMLTPNQSREPQSIPEELIRTPIPRSSEEVLQNKDMVLMKVAQQAPDMYDQIDEVLTNNPESVGDLLPVMAQAMPHLFSRDKYNRIDGVILDPVKKEMAREDLMQNEDLSNAQRMMMMNKLNKTGEFEL